jgi:cystathionine gamma-synthase
MHSATKYLNGHTDVMPGPSRARRTTICGGECATFAGRAVESSGPLEAWLLLRGMRTLHLRVARCCGNAQAIAERFHGHAKLSASCSIRAFRPIRGMRSRRNRCAAVSAG